MTNLSMYISKLKSLVLSFLCDHTTIKCIDSTSTFQYLACPIRLLEELSFEHPCHSIVMQTLENFHKKYSGCSCKYFLFFLTNFYEQLTNLIEERTIFDELDKLIQKSKFIARNQFAESDLSWNFETFERICRYQTNYAQCLHEAYLHLNLNFKNLIHLTQVRSVEEKSVFLSGLLISTNEKIEGTYRTILLDGYLLEDYVHVGYNNQMKTKQISTKSSWFYLISSILEEYKIDIVLCTGTIDDKFKTMNNSSRIFIENLSTKILRLCDENLMINYLTDLNEENILQLNYRVYSNEFTVIEFTHCGTILQCVPCDYLIDLKHEQLSHCIGRCQEIMKTNIYLAGSGLFETQLYKYIYENEEMNSSSECFLRTLDLFIQELSNRKDLFQSNLIDDFNSKFDAWTSSIDLLKIFFQIDQILEITDTDDLTDI